MQIQREPEIDDEAPIGNGLTPPPGEIIHTLTGITS